MNFFKSIFSRELSCTSEQSVHRYMSAIRFHGAGQLTPEYSNLLEEAILDIEPASSFLNELVQQINTGSFYGSKHANSLKYLMKMMTILHSAVKLQDYKSEVIMGLENLQMVFVKGMFQKESEGITHSSYRSAQLETADDEKWLLNLFMSYLVYLIKMPSMADIYQQASCSHYTTHSPKELTEIYRIIHQIKIIIPSFHHAVNVVGRYQKSEYPEMKQMYKVVTNELVCLHKYLKWLVENLLRDYKTYEYSDLQCFVMSLPELELVCDQIYDLLSNKYFKGAKAAVIELKEEKVAELQYYLEYEYKEAKPSDQILK